MQIRYNRVLSFILAVFLLFSGVCSEDVQADSFFTCPSQYGVDSVLASVDTDAGYDGMCAIEIVQARYSKVLMNVRNRSSVKSNMRTSFVLPNRQLVLFDISNFYKITADTEAPIWCHQAAILHYIHNQDGEKEIGFQQSV